MSIQSVQQGTFSFLQNLPIVIEASASRLSSDAGLLTSGLIASQAQAGAKKPNVLLLVTDDQRAATIAALGNAVMKTPNLVKIVQRGFTFRNAYCMGSTVGAICNPSRHMLLSGKSLYRYNSERWPTDP